jgi:hypothetical protein
LSSCAVRDGDEALLQNEQIPRCSGLNGRDCSSHARAHCIAYGMTVRRTI